MERGLYYALIALVLWGFLDATSRFSVVTLEANPLVFTCYNLFIGGVLLIALGGQGWGNKETFLNPYTWAFGLLRILLSLFLVLGYIFVTASEGSFMLRISTIFAILLLWLAFRRTPHLQDIPGAILMVLGFLIIGLHQPGALLNPGVLFVLLAAVCDALINVVAEKHPISNQAVGFKTRCRYTGMVLAVSSFVTLIFTACLTGLSAATPLLHTTLFWLPSWEDFINPYTIIAAGIAGVFLRAPSMYFYLFAARLVKADTILMLSTLATFSVLFAESIFGFFGLLDISQLQAIDVIAGVIMTFGALWMAWNRFQRNKANAT